MLIQELVCKLVHKVVDLVKNSQCFLVAGLLRLQSFVLKLQYINLKFAKMSLIRGFSSLSCRNFL